MIRHIQSPDIGWLMKLAVEFNDAFGLPPLDYTRSRRTLLHLINEGVALRTDDGAIVGLVMDDPFRDERHLVEIGWYSTGRDGLALLKKFQQIARDQNCTGVRMTTLHNSPAKATRILEHIGYRPTENGWGLQL